MIDLIIALLTALVNGYVIYLQWLRFGFPDMFNSLNGILSVGLFAASLGYLITGLIVPPYPEEYYEEEQPEQEAEAEKVWHEIQKPQPFRQTFTEEAQEKYHIRETPLTMSFNPTPSHNGDFLTNAIARAIANADLKGDIGVHIEVPEHEINMGGNKATMRAVINLMTPQPTKQQITQPPIQPEPYQMPTDIRKLIKDKIAELEGD